MSTYTIESIENGVAKVRYADNSWAEIEISSTMTEAEFDDLAYSFKRKNDGTAPSFMTVGASRTAAAAPEAADPNANPAWLQARLEAYGTPTSQLEYIAENGLAAWQTQVAQIKADNPKPSED